ncbi:PIN-like domain-containing protein [Pendulispora brunnea]|uniref:PIN-like domain-containing protein n=1 Tax=Pendulispora brunnea TaxID=2905690 RepID=A0ABZ2KK08_9BACT
MSQTRHPFSSFHPFAERAEEAFVPVIGRVDRETALVVLDANVLLAPYQTSSATLDEIERIYGKLRADGRLIVPAQAAREFARNRPNLITALYKRVRDARAVGLNGSYELPPAVRGMPEHRIAADELDKIHAALKSHRRALDALAKQIASWHHSDPVLEVYNRLFDSTVVREVSLDAKTVEEIRRSRYETRIPPGYKDKSKDDGGGGDLVIWLTILEAATTAKLDTIFVSEETKADWFHRADNEPVFLRYELMQEYRSATSGKIVSHLTLSGLLAYFGAKESVIQEVKHTESEAWLFSSERILTPQHYVPPNELARLVESMIVARLREVAGSIAIVATQVGTPDIIVELPSQRIGVDIIVAPDVEYSSRSVILGIERALAAFRSGQFAEVAIVIVALDSRTASKVESKFAEEGYLGPGASAVVLESTPAGLRTALNQASHPILKQAFPIAPLERSGS